MEKSESIKNIAGALVKFHSLVGKIPKDAKNPFFNSTYADLSTILEVINPHLVECGLAVTQLPIGENQLTTMLLHADSGEYISGTYFMKPAQNNPQGIGSCITYQRRYALAAALSLNIDSDDDGNIASQPPKQQPKANTEAQPAQQAPANKPAPKALTDAQVKKACESDEKTINQFLNAIEKGTATATPAQKKQLEDKLAELKPKK